MTIREAISATGLPPMLIERARIVDPSRGLDAVGSVIIENGVIRAAGPEVLNQGHPEAAEIVDGTGLVCIPGLVDGRVFVGEPGAEHRETLATASAAAAAGGVTTMVTMPNTDPVIDDPALVDFLRRRASATSRVKVAPMAALTRGAEGKEMTEIGLLSEAGAVAFTDGKAAIANAALMRRALIYARDFEALIVNHVEEPTLASGVMNAGERASRLGLTGVPREAETIMLDRDLRLVAATKGRYHAAQISCADAVEAMRGARERGLDVSCGVSIAHLTLNEIDIGTYRSFLKMSPPLRSEEDRVAMVQALADGLIDWVVSSHDPQDSEMKRHPFAEAADGAVGLETLLPAALRLVHGGEIGLAALIRALSTAPARRLGLNAGTLSAGASADLVLLDIDEPWVLDRAKLASRSKNTPFEEARFTGRVLRTLVAGRTVYRYGRG